MHDATDLLRVIKQAALDAVKASNPVSVNHGKVTGVSPLKVQINQKITLSEAQLLQCKEIGTIEDGDEVILLREQGGQKYIILGVI